MYVWVWVGVCVFLLWDSQKNWTLLQYSKRTNILPSFPDWIKVEAMPTNKNKNTFQIQVGSFGLHRN